jgi:trigger factor
MQTSLESLDQLTRRLNVAVPIAQIEGEVQKRLARLARTAKIAGFRPGKVPLKMVAQQYGQQVRSDVISDAVNDSFNDAVRSQNLRVAGYPRIERRDDAASQEALEFSAVFEIYPDVSIPDVSGLAINRPQAEVAPADIDRTIEVLRKQRTRYAPVQRAAQTGDRVIVDFSGTVDGVAFPGGQAQDFPINIGEGRMLPDFETATVGIAAGETRDFSLTFPADYHGKEVAGKVAHFTLTAKEVAEAHVPPLDEAFAKAFGIASGSVPALRAEVEANLRLELKRKIEALVKDQALKGLRAILASAIAGPDRSTGIDATDGAKLAATRRETRGHQAQSRNVSYASGGAGCPGFDRRRAGARRRLASASRAGQGHGAGDCANVRAAGRGRALAL